MKSLTNEGADKMAEIKFDKLKELKRMIIISSVSASAVRNQGNGIAEPIRNALLKDLSLNQLFKKIKSQNDSDYIKYLNKLTNKIAGLRGISNNKNRYGVVKWGTARKCVNLVIRTLVYNGFIWSKFGIKANDFKINGIMRKLELPIDSYVAQGIIDNCKKLNIRFANRSRGFSIIRLKESENTSYQQNATEIAQRINVCRIDLDLLYWRNNKNKSEV